MKNKISLIIVIIGVILIICGIFINIFYFEKVKENNSKEIIENGTTINENGDKVQSSIDPNNYTKEKDGSMINKVESISSEHKKDDLTISNMNITVGAEEDLALYTFSIKNNSNDTINALNISVVFILSDGTKFVNPIPTIDKIAPGEEIKIKESSFVKIISSVDYEFTYTIGN
ncbi:MAG: hypothetical protein Q4E69_02490 [Bacilli bacterium]|nr:hypothetical protein [Bacilli bacterium]